MTWQILLLIALAIAALWFGRRRAKGPLLPESLFRVVFDADSILVTDPAGEQHSVPWSDLNRVGIRTTDDGPWSPDVFWGLHASTSETPVVYPGGATGENELLREFGLRLPGFRTDQVVAAMASTDNNYFVLWEKAPEFLVA